MLTEHLSTSVLLFYHRCDHNAINSPNYLLSQSSNRCLIIFYIACAKSHVNFPQLSLALDVILIHFNQSRHIAVTACIYITERFFYDSFTILSRSSRVVSLIRYLITILLQILFKSACFIHFKSLIHNCIFLLKELFFLCNVHNLHFLSRVNSNEIFS